MVEIAGGEGAGGFLGVADVDLAGRSPVGQWTGRGIGISGGRIGRLLKNQVEAVRGDEGQIEKIIIVEVGDHQAPGLDVEGITDAFETPIALLAEDVVDILGLGIQGDVLAGLEVFFLQQ